MINTNAELVAAINKVLNYMWNDEETDFERQKKAGESTESHIYNTLCELDEWVSE